MLRRLLEHELVEKIDPNEPARDAEEGREVAEEVFKQHPELSVYATPANLETLETYFAGGRELTVRTFTHALRDLAAAGKLTTVEEQAEAEAEVRRKLKEQEQPEKTQQARDAAGKFAVSPEFAAEVAKMPAAEIKRKYETAPTFRKKYETLVGFKRPAPQKQPEAVEPIELTAEQYRSMPAAVVAQKMRNPAFVAAVEKLVAEGKL